MKKKFCCGGSCLGILIIIIIIAAIFYFYSRRVSDDVVYKDPVDTEEHWGTISGSVGYPSEAIPEMGICAETPESVDQYCTYELLEGEEYTYGLGYTIKVPPGEYQVFAHLLQDNENIGYTDEDKAYYSEFVTCGFEIECPSHDPIKVEVAASQHIQGIDPVDWYDF